MTDHAPQIALAGALLALSKAFTDAGLAAPRMLLVNGRTEALKLLLVLSNTHAAEVIDQHAEPQATVNEYGVWHWFDCNGLKIGWPHAPRVSADNIKKTVANPEIKIKPKGKSK